MSLMKEQLAEQRQKALTKGRAEGKSIAELAEQYRLSPLKVRKALQEAEKEAILGMIEDGTFTVLIPKALAALEKALDQGNLKAVELTMALMGTVKTSVKAKTNFEIAIPEGKAVGIMALEEIRREKNITPAGAPSGGKDS
jgi:DNA-binding transcriptional regulator YhcF (GntR family)